MPLISKTILGIVLLVAVGTSVYVVSKPNTIEVSNQATSTVISQEETASAKTPTPTATTTAPVATAGLTVGLYTLITNESSITWEAQKPLISGYVHTGTIGLKSGSLDVKNTNSTTGTFIIDMNTIKVTSLGGGKAGKESALEAHLKNKDFFDVTTYSTGVFTIDSIKPISGSTYQVQGKLTLKGITKPVAFPIIFSEKDGKLTADGSVSIDRTLWQITIASKSILGDAANNMIDDMIKLKLHLVAR